MEHDALKKQFCNILIEDVRAKMQLLKSYGVSEKDIIFHIHGKRQFHKLIVSHDYRIFLGDKRNEVCLEPLLKSVFILFLKHQEGIMFKDLPDYREELTVIYTKVRRGGMTDRTRRSIEDVTNPLLNSINEKCARIRKAFVDILDKSTAEHYYIKGKRGEAKRISLPKNLIIWGTGQTLLEKKAFSQGL